MIRFFLILFSGLLVFVSAASALNDREQAMVDRMAPLGEVCMAGDACAASSGAGASGPRAAEDIYAASCQACHLTGASNAPLLGNVEQWAPRIATGKEALYQSVFNGVEVDGVLVMPVNGLCTDCTEEELMSVVDYMVAASE